MEFVLKIELGNDAMQSPYDVAGALLQIAADLRRNGFMAAGETARIHDANGNTVGTWGTTE